MKHTYLLISICNNKELSCDSCKDIEALIISFIDAYKYYIGGNPTENELGRFLLDRKINVVNNGCLNYTFTF